MFRKLADAYCKGRIWSHLPWVPEAFHARFLVNETPRRTREKTSGTQGRSHSILVYISDVFKSHDSPTSIPTATCVQPPPTHPPGKKGRWSSCTRTGSLIAGHPVTFICKSTKNVLIRFARVMICDLPVYFTFLTMMRLLVHFMSGKSFTDSTDIGRHIFYTFKKLGTASPI